MQPVFRPVSVAAIKDGRLALSMGRTVAQRQDHLVPSTGFLAIQLDEGVGGERIVLLSCRGAAILSQHGSRPDSVRALPPER